MRSQVCTVVSLRRVLNNGSFVHRLIKQVCLFVCYELVVALQQSDCCRKRGVEQKRASQVASCTVAHPLRNDMETVCR